MPNIRDTQPVPDVQIGDKNNTVQTPDMVGKVEISDVKKIMAEYRNIFMTNENSQLGCMVLDPKKVQDIPYMPMFFENLDKIDPSWIIEKAVIQDPNRALEIVQNRLLDYAQKTFDEHNNAMTKTFGLIVEKNRNDIVVKGCVECQLDKFSTQFNLAPNSKLFGLPIDDMER